MTLSFFDSGAADAGEAVFAGGFAMGGAILLSVVPGGAAVGGLAAGSGATIPACGATVEGDALGCDD